MQPGKKVNQNVALLVTLISLFLEVLWQHFSQLQLNLFLKLLIAAAIGLMSYYMADMVLRLVSHKRKMILCGLYFVIYKGDKNKHCSIIRIKYNQTEERYVEEIYDYHNGGNNSAEHGGWKEVPDYSPLIFDDLFFESRSNRIHLVADSVEKKSCIFIEFINQNESSSFLRYDGKKTLTGDGHLYRLTSKELCIAFNDDFNNTARIGCGGKDDPLTKGQKCSAEKREFCDQDFTMLCRYVDGLEKNELIRIPECLYEIFVNKENSASEPPQRTRRNTPQSLISQNQTVTLKSVAESPNEVEKGS